MILNYQAEKQWRGLEYIVVVIVNSDCDTELCISDRQVVGNGEENTILYQQFLSLRGHHTVTRRAKVFVANKLFISTWLGGAINFPKFYNMFIMFI